MKFFMLMASVMIPLMIIKDYYSIEDPYSSIISLSGMALPEKQ